MGRKSKRYLNKYNRWTFVDVVENKGGYAFWKCRCDCGVEKIIHRSNVVRGLSKSCGCWNVEVRGKSSITHGEGSIHKKTKEYRVWTSIKVRCLNKNSRAYAWYGARGIKFCDRWAKYENFLEDMGRCPPGMSLDRIDNDGNYEKSNCRWTDKITQANNTRTNRWIFYDGRRQTMAEWGREIGVRPQLIAQRLDRDGWSVERVLTKDFSHFPSQLNMKRIQEETKSKGDYYGI